MSNKLIHIDRGMTWQDVIDQINAGFSGSAVGGGYSVENIDITSRGFSSAALAEDAISKALVFGGSHKLNSFVRYDQYTVGIEDCYYIDSQTITYILNTVNTASKTTILGNEYISVSLNNISSPKLQVYKSSTTSYSIVSSTRADYFNDILDLKWLSIDKSDLANGVVCKVEKFNDTNLLTIVYVGRPSIQVCLFSNIDTIYTNRDSPIDGSYITGLFKYESGSGSKVVGLDDTKRLEDQNRGFYSLVGVSSGSVLDVQLKSLTSETILSILKPTNEVILIVSASNHIYIYSNGKLVLLNSNLDYDTYIIDGGEV